MLTHGTRVLVTGGAGFIGSRLVHALLGMGAYVRVLDDFSTGHRERLSGLGRGLELLHADVRNPATVARAASGAQAIVHLAGLSASDDPARAQEVNLGGALNVLESARRTERSQRPRVILCGSGSVYGRHNAFVLHEELPTQPCTADSVMALCAEQYGRVYRDVHGVPVNCLRLFRVFGPGEDAERASASVVAHFTKAALDGTAPRILGDGQQTRDIIYVDNVVQAVIAATQVDCPDPLNIASGEAVTVNFLWTLILGLTGKRRLAIEPTYLPAPGWDSRHSRPQIARSCKVLRWAPTVRLRDGLGRTMQHCQSLRNRDPNGWFTPKNAGATRVGGAHPKRPPLPPQPGSTEEVLAADDLVIFEEDEPSKQAEVEWAPVPIVPGLGR